MSHTGTRVVPPRDKGGPTVGHPYIEEPSIEPSSNHKERVTEKMCVEVYEKYPRRKGRAAALKAIKTAIKDFGFDALVSLVDVFAAEWFERLASGDD
jgi:hypothetical protein